MRSPGSNHKIMWLFRSHLLFNIKRLVAIATTASYDIRYLGETGSALKSTPQISYESKYILLVISRGVCFATSNAVPLLF